MEFFMADPYVEYQTDSGCARGGGCAAYEFARPQMLRKIVRILVPTDIPAAASSKKCLIGVDLHYYLE
jgi:hypothetical protein